MSESQNSIQRSLKLLEETKEIANNVIHNLEIQGEKLDKINDDLIIIEQKQKQSDRLLIYLSGLWSRITTRFQDPLLVQTPDNNHVQKSNNSHVQQTNNESDTLLSDLNKSLTELNTQARHMNQTLHTQNDTIEKINNRADIANINFTRLNNKMKTML